MNVTTPAIVPHLWFDQEAEEAARFYCSLFPDSALDSVVTLPGTPAGDCDVVSFRLWGQPFMAISAGPAFRFNPSISFMVNFDPAQDRNATASIDRVWAALAEGGQPLMPLDRYPFSERYGWIQDRYGLSWQLILTDPAGEPRPPILPSLLFVGDVCGKADEAADFYVSVFSHARRGEIARYPAGMEPDREGTVMFTDFLLGGRWFVAMDSAQAHQFGFNEAVSFMVLCDSQQEIDRYWQRLSAVPAAEQCGWLKDRYGVSWQVVPAELGRMMEAADHEQRARIMQAMFKMKKLDVAALRSMVAGH